MSITLDGLEELFKDLEQLEDTTAYEAAMQKACALVERSAKQKAPKGSGELRRSITSKVEADSSDVRGVIFTPLHYAPYVEYGTGLFAEETGRQDVPWSYQDDKGEWHTTCGMQPHPYMRPALADNKEKILRLLKGAIQND